ncbi:hypothetical protein LXL04_011869 [Taraxacum kok-saghyz]
MMSYPKLQLSIFLFFFFISLATSSSSYFNNTTKCSIQQAFTLLQFKENISSTDDSSYDWECHRLGYGNHPIMMNWNKHTDCCKWDGITCDHFTGDVIGIDLSCGMLQGTIHLNTTLFHIPHLQRLNLAFNSFAGSQLPREIGRYSNSLTHLNLSNCWFNGEIPSEIFLLSNLVSLDLSKNWGFRIQNHVLNNLLGNSTHLRDLLISGVNISGVLPNLNISSSLKALDLSYTNLQGKLPDNIFKLQNLELLDLSYTYLFTSTLPEVAINQSSLRFLKLRGTGLQGKLPSDIFNLQILEHLDLSDNLLTGTFPEVTINQSSLRILELSHTELEGKLPDEIFNLHNLEHLDLAVNNITGPLPKVNTSTNIALEWLDLSFTNSLGELPDSIGQLISLDHLYLFDSGLVGPLPKSLVNLRHLIAIDLSYNKLNGTLPAFLFTLPLIQHINLDENMFSGGLPSEFYNCRSLQLLYLSSNQFNGEINQGSTPPSFVQLINLKFLSLSWNNFTGLWELESLLSSLPKLQTLDLSYSGVSIVTTNATHYHINPGFRELALASCNLILFPESLQEMKDLEYLDLSNNDIHGEIPHWAGEIGGYRLSGLNLSHNSITRLPQSLWVGLESLSLQANLIEGAIPPSFCNMSNLNYLDISNNRFDGMIPNMFIVSVSLVWLILKDNHLEGNVPISLASCEYLEILDLGNNRLNGTFPGWLGDLPRLQVLVLKSNNFHGPINTSSEFNLSFPLLQVLDLSHNGFIGHLPHNLFQKFNAMKSGAEKSRNPQYLNTNGLYYSLIVVVKGGIPNVIGTLKLLIALNLSHNNLNGQIPDALGNLSEIESLDLSWNQLTGEIPQGIADNTNLEVLNLSHNNLKGRIPNGRQFITFDEYSFGGNPRLCGFPLPKHCEHQSSPQLESEGEGDEEESGLTWKVVMMGFGCGTLIGLVMGLLMLSTGRPKWFNEIADSVEYMLMKLVPKCFGCRY